ncbi:hypothetical protein M422DRAFT_783796 [Sphaerobolus stellatus SS14]|uniref:Uncharacterized protein n=1 Tax=Sphaerobolus stellatus (strain SS14) TaxID=990650 RepID=A0A0C9V1K0_SPHS4|nr:hypothetical protein M422DRAFT_783796 [Sphaerobolus stellatus SS14]
MLRLCCARVRAEDVTNSECLIEFGAAPYLDNCPAAAEYHNNGSDSDSHLVAACLLPTRTSSRGLYARLPDPRRRSRRPPPTSKDPKFAPPLAPASAPASAKMLLFSMELSFPVLLAAFSLCTSMLAVLGTVQLVISAPPAAHQGAMAAPPHQHQHHSQHPQHSQYAKVPHSDAGSGPTQTLEVGLGMQKRMRPWWGTTVSPSDPAFIPLETRPPLSMAKLIMLRHAETQRKANARARLRLAQMASY